MAFTSGCYSYICNVIKNNTIMTYSTITKETFNTICVAYPDKDGVETENSLNDYEARSQGSVELIFTESQKEAVELLKSF